MKRTLVTVAGATALVALVFGAPASAADPVAGCGKGNQLVTIEDGLDAVDWRIYTAEEEAEIRSTFPPIIDTNEQERTTWHSLGGVPMGDAVDRHGRVHGHRGLYVLDGARIPGSTGACNPSMTIAALAEHSMATIVREDVGAVF